MQRLLRAPYVIAFTLIVHVSILLPIYAQTSPDFDNDGWVGFTDFIIFTQSFGARQGDARYNARLDLDNNGEIGFTDFIRFTQQFGQKVEMTSNITRQTLDPAAGATLTLDSGLEIIIPPNAISGSGTIRIEPITLTSEQEPQNRLTDVYDIQLSEADILSPVEIAIPYNPLNLPSEATLETIFLAYWDGENWRPVPSIVDEKTIRAQVSHFSIWSGMFGQTPSASLFIALPDTLTLNARAEETLTFQLVIDPASNNLEDLRLRLAFTLTDSITPTAAGKITLRDNGTEDQTLTETIAGFKLRSIDPSPPLDGIYGLELIADGSVLTAPYKTLIANATITTRRIASIATDTAIAIPVKRLVIGHTISGQITKDGIGIPDVTVILSGPVITTTTTDENGQYQFAELDDAVYVITPSKAERVFTPQSRTITLAGEDIADIDFTDILSTANYSAGQALQLDGGGYLEISIITDSALQLSNGAFTIEAWIQPDDREARAIVANWANDSGPYVLGTRDLGVRGQTEVYTTQLSSAPPLDTWTHYALSFQNNLITFYRNGRKIIDAIPGFQDLSASHDHIRIGASQSDILPFKGKIDELRIWNRALSEREIRDNMHKSLSTALALQAQSPSRAKQAATLIGYWNFNTQNANGAIPDLSGQNNNGILVNAQQAASQAPIASSGGNPVLQIFPSELTITGTSEINLDLTNVGSGQLVWTINEEAPWLRVTSPIGDTGGDGSFYGSGTQNLTIYTSELGLEGGTHRTNLFVWSSGGLLDIPITFVTTLGGTGSGSGLNGQNIATITTLAGTTHEMIQIPEGEFSMGSNQGESNAQPEHTVYLDGYRIDRFEVTNEQYRAFVQTTGHRASEFVQNAGLNGTTQPIVGIAWRDADAYCQWIGGRLPTEAEWEKAARGTDGRTYPWGETTPDETLLNFNRAIGNPVAVGSYPTGVSPYQLFDMAGNVWEWTHDYYGSTYYLTSPDSNPQGPTQGTLRVIRGGSWGEESPFMRTFNRFWSSPNASTDLIGFRCVITK